MYSADFMNPMLILFCHFDIPYLVVFDGGESLLQIQSAVHILYKQV